MQTVQLDIPDNQFDTFLTIVKSLQKGIVQNIRLQSDGLDIEPIETNSQDFVDLQLTKSKNNPQYTLKEAKARLGL